MENHKKLDIEQLHILQKEAVSELDEFLNELEIMNDCSKSEKISYWIKDYINYLKFENIFEPNKNKKYKRGEIVQIHMGFRIGREFGGVHFGIVLNKNNSINDPVITIAPLTSLKPNKDLNNLRPSEIYIGSEIYDKSMKKALNQINEINKEIQILSKTIDEKTKEVNQLPKEINLSEIESKLISINSGVGSLLSEKLDKLNLKAHSTISLANSIKKMKLGSIVLANQISTFSKIRILNPVKPDDTLSGIRVSNETMDKIDNYIKTHLIKS